jgi:hypothetical protein
MVEAFSKQLITISDLHAELRACALAKSACPANLALADRTSAHAHQLVRRDLN